MKTYIIENSDGTVTRLKVINKNMPLVNHIQRMYPKHQSKIKNIQQILNQEVDVSTVCKEVEVLPDEYFRSAWTIENNNLSIDINKAKEIKKQVFRELRQPKLDTLDIEYQKADEVNDTNKKQAIVIKKQELRDITKLPLPDDIQELKDFIPDCLK